MNAPATLSIVIPARNAADTLAETLDSLLGQTRGDWQAIIVDDGSTDTTRQIGQSYATRDGRVGLLSDGRLSQGASSARNRGIAEARGRWLLFLDSDDWIESTFIARMVGALEAHGGAGVAYCGSYYVSTDGRHGPAWFSVDVAELAFESFARQCPIVIHGLVVERALVVELGGFDPSLRTSEDWDLWHRVARTGVPFLPVPAPLAPYRMRRKSLSTDARAMLADARIVIERAFAADPRVPRPAALHASGADPDSAGGQELAVGQFALWCAAFDVGAGGTGKGLVAPLPDRWGSPLETCRTTILAGLRSGARVLPGDPIGDSPTFLAAARDLLEQVEHAATRPGLARVLEFALEPEVLRPSRLTERLAAGRVLLIRLNVGNLQTVDVSPDIDTLNIEFRTNTQSLARTEAPVFRSMSARELTSIAIEAISLSVFLEKSELLMRPRFWLHLAVALLQLPAALRHARPRRGPKSVFRLRALARTATVTAALAFAGRHTKSANELALERLAAEGREQATATDIGPSPEAALAPPEEAYVSNADRGSYWDHLYRTPDPWAYRSDYEQLKYRRMLELLPPGAIAKAAELGCSEGRFSEMLAPRVGQLTAVDVSETALARARTRCRTVANVDFRRLDFFDEELPPGFDLLVCSEALYFLADRAQLARVSAKLAGAVAPGGRLLVAHGLLLKDSPSRTGFDWDMPFGGQVIADTFAAIPGLALERSLQTELYRIDLFRRLKAGETPPSAQIETVDLGPPPEPPYARHIVWDGAEVRRAEVRVTESTDRLPILTYHRIADDGPASLARYRVTPAAFAEQMRWLRRHGYHAVTSGDVARQLASGRPFEGRPVMITFDDGYRDFHDVAWPILRAHDFSAEVMVVTDRVGGTAEWDADYGPPAPLMGWTEIQALGTSGICFGSHMASHSHMIELSSRDIVVEAARSRALIERALGCECLSIAAPFGEADDRFVRIAAQCGYRIGLTTAPGFTHLTYDPLRLPRIEVAGAWSLVAFASALRPER